MADLVPQRRLATADGVFAAFQGVAALAGGRLAGGQYAELITTALAVGLESAITLPSCWASSVRGMNDLLAVAIVGAQSERFYEVHLEMWNGEEWRCIQTGEIVKDRSELCWPFSSSHDSLMVHPDFKARKAIERNWTWPVESDGK